MRIAAAALLVLIAAAATRSTTVRLTADTAESQVERGVLRLHYVAKPIGYERYTIAQDEHALTLSSDFAFTDRGGEVHLTATLRAKPDYTPIAFTATGKSYRFVNVDADVRIDGSDALV